MRRGAEESAHEISLLPPLCFVFELPVRARERRCECDYVCCFAVKD